MTSKQRCTEHAQATLPRLKREHLGPGEAQYDTPTLGDWLEVIEKQGLLLENGDVYDSGILRIDVLTEDYREHLTFNLTTNEPDNWDTLAELLNL